MCELALTKAQSEKRKVKSAKRKAKARFNAPHNLCCLQWMHLSNKCM